jgi:hypothetical protein
VQDALANFIEILPEVPTHILEQKGQEIVALLLSKLRMQIDVVPFVKYQ